VKTLDLSNNPIGSEDASAFAGMLATNESLTELVMNGCSIEGEGALAFASMLKSNNCLQTLELNDDSFGVEGAVNLIESLKHNNTIAKLRLSCECEPPSFSTSETALKECVVFY